MEELREALWAIVREAQPVTVRQAFYLAVSAALIDKTESEYRGTVMRLLSDMRLEGVLPFDWIADNTRWMRKPPSYQSLSDFCAQAQRFYRRDLWAGQDAYIEVWTEKDALAGVLLDVTYQWDVPLMVSRGFASLSFLHQIRCSHDCNREANLLVLLRRP